MRVDISYSFTVVGLGVTQDFASDPASKDRFQLVPLKIVGFTALIVNP